jgi:hypothetical protein
MQAQLGQQALDWYKQQFSDFIMPEQQKMDDLTGRAIGLQMQVAQQQADQSGAYFNSWKQNTLPALQKFSQNAMDFSTPSYQESLASRAAADAAAAFSSTMGATDRAMESRGVNPNSGAFLGLRNQNALALAATRAGAMTNARMQGLQYGNNMLAQAAGLGAGLTGASTGAAQVGAGAAGSAVGSQGAALQTGLQGVNTGGQGFNTGLAGYAGMGSTLNTQYGNQLQAWGMQQQANSQMWGGVGQLAGQAGMAYAIMHAAPAAAAAT